MDADLERLIALQKLDSAAHEAERALATEPERLKGIEAKLEAARARVAAAKDQVAENQNARRALEKELSVHQGRLSKFREQAMAVKTNQEYHAIQHEITFAQTEIKKLEDGMLELMMAADELTAAVKAADAALAAEQKVADAEKKALTAEHDTMRAALERLKAERVAVVSALTPQALAIFESISKRRHGVAMAAAKDGICTICHVRLRPQVFNTVLKNEQIVQCDSCNRILYFVPAPQPAPAAQPAS
jgi:predicted  nucleic acid-binding Zn-ribbon protein